MTSRLLLLLLGSTVLLTVACGGREDEPVSATSTGALVRVLREGRGEPLEHLAIRYRVELETGQTVASNEASLEGPLFLSAGGAAPSVPGGAVLRDALEGLRAGEARSILVPLQAGTGLNVDVTWTVEALDLPGVRVARSGTAFGDEAALGSRLRLRMEGRVAGAALPFLAREEAFALRLTRDGGLIEGCLRGLLGARAGERLLIEVPAVLAYGRGGRRPSIPADADLVFAVEVLAVDP